MTSEQTADCLELIFKSLLSLSTKLDIKKKETGSLEGAYSALKSARQAQKRKNAWLPADR